jgi:hypothetical protein
MEMNIVEQNIAFVSELCKQHHVKNMYLFGSDGQIYTGKRR